MFSLVLKALRVDTKLNRELRKTNMLISSVNIIQKKTQAENPENNKNTGLRDKLLPGMNHLFRKIIEIFYEINQLLRGIKLSRFGVIHLLRGVKVSRFGVIHLLRGVKVSRFGVIHLFHGVILSRFGVIHLFRLIKISFREIFSPFISPLTRRFLLTDYNPQYSVKMKLLTINT